MDGIKKVDIILIDFFLRNNSGHFFTYEDIDAFVVKYCEQHNIQLIELGTAVQYKIMQKLVKDGYVSVDELSLPKSHDTVHTTVTRFNLNIDGEEFAKEGGYTEKIKRTNAENNRLQTLVQEQQRNQKAMTRLTWIIAIGTAVAALFYLKELFK